MVNSFGKYDTMDGENLFIDILLVMITPLFLTITGLLWVLVKIDSFFGKFIYKNYENPIVVATQILVILTYGLPQLIVGIFTKRRDRRPQTTTYTGGVIPEPLPPLRDVINEQPIKRTVTKLDRQRNDYNNGKPLKFTLK
jgi:hypothetical protein